MSNNNTSVSEYIKQGAFLLLIASLVLFGIKSYRKFQQKKQVMIELNTHINDISRLRTILQRNGP